MLHVDNGLECACFESGSAAENDCGKLPQAPSLRTSRRRMSRTLLLLLLLGRLQTLKLSLGLRYAGDSPSVNAQPDGHAFLPSLAFLALAGLLSWRRAGGAGPREISFQVGNIPRLG